MTIKILTVFVAGDGERFDEERKAVEHERSILVRELLGRNTVLIPVDQIDAHVTRILALKDDIVKALTADLRPGKLAGERTTRLFGSDTNFHKKGHAPNWGEPNTSPEKVFNPIPKSTHDKPDIPADVYYNPEVGNFYDAQHGTGMGMDFHARWFTRAKEFPVVLANDASVVSDAELEAALKS